ncbi:proto-oncogene tyrosine-protein kinase ROS-like isoform X2, partial [Octopus vulgaris]
ESKTEQKSLCDKECKLKNCSDGCQLYRAALHSSCHQLCYNPQHKDEAWPELTVKEEAWPRLTVKEKSCETGCTTALNLYEKRKTDELENATLPAPEINRYNVTHSSVHLLWRTNQLVSNITYMIQMKMPEISENWQLWNSTELHEKPGIHFIVNDLHPYTTYQFKVIAFIKIPDQFLVSNESVSVITLPHGKPSSAPKISSVATPSPTVITIIWNPPLYPNGRITGYKLMLSYVNERTITREVSEHTHSWSFSQLQHSKNYTIKVLAWNAVGGGPADTHIITTPDLMLEAETEKPYLVLAANNMILKQNLLDVFGDPVTLHQENNRSITVFDVGVHIKNHLVLFSDSNGRVHVVFTNSSKQKENIYPTVKNPKAIAVDWLHNKAYLAGDQEIYQCFLPPQYTCHLAVSQLQARASDIKVDPINGFLYYTQSGPNNGIFRVDLGDIESGKNVPPLQIVKNKQDSFTIDFENIQLYFPNSSLNTIMSTFLDGKGPSNIRQNVVKANFNNIKSIVFFNGSFIWTDGQKVLKEVYDQHGGKYHYNTIHFKESSFSGFNMFHSSAQPMPVPTNPPSNLAVLFSDTTADIRWNKPEKLIYQGNGCWRGWKYEMTVQEGDAKNLTTYHLDGFNLTLENLKPETKYTIKMRAYIDNKHGPWTKKFVGRTLFKDNVKPIITYHTKAYIAQVGLDGRTRRGQLLDGGNDRPLRIYKHKIVRFYVNYPHVSGTPFKLVGKMKTVRPLTIAYDWLSKVIYWSNKRCGICRLNKRPSKVESINSDVAYDLCIDSLKGVFYWNTKYSVRASHLNGMNIKEYYEKPFQEETIIAMTIDMDSYILYWILPTSTGARLFMAGMVGYKTQFSKGPPKIIDLESRMNQLQYFSYRFVWLNSEKQLIVSDLRGRNSSRLINIDSDIMAFSLFHPSQHKYPDGLNETTITVIPNDIPAGSIRVEGNASYFNITWREASEVNHGVVHYELTLNVREFEKYSKALDTVQPWYTIKGMPPYTEIDVIVKPLTYYGSAKRTSTKIRSPMSVPNEPLNPRVYINKRKELQSSEEFLSADLRWSAPNNRFGVLEKYKVFYQTDSSSSQWQQTDIEPHTRQFITERLGANRTYTFKIQACTVFACSKMSVNVSITSNNTNPLPELLIASEEGIKLAEMDNDLKISKKISFKGSTRAFTFLAKDNSYFWINDGSTLIMRNNKMEKITLKKFKKEVNDLTVDWIDHTLYIAAGAEIHCYNIYIKAPCVRRHGNGVIYSVKVSPFTSTLFWTETEDMKNSRVFKSRTDGSDVIEILPAQHSRLHKRSPGKNCQCPTDVKIDSTLGVDYTNDDIYFVDLLEKSLWRTDSDGCQCQKLFSQTSNEFESLNSLTTDHSRVYWSNKNNNGNNNNIYSVRKNDGKDLRKNQVSNVNKIVAFGSHLQPLPDQKCLISLPKDNSITVASRTNTSITLRLSDIKWHQDCNDVSHPTTNYTIHYTELKPGMDDASCAKNIPCHAVVSFLKETVIYPLKPFTKYLFQVAVSNIYTDYRADILSLPQIEQTLAGVPTSIRNLEAFTLTYEDIKISWKPPVQPNGNVNLLVYVVTSTTTLSTGEIQKNTIKLLHSKIYRNESNTLEYILKNLKPEHEYKIQAKACESEIKWCSNTLEATNKTAKHLSPIGFHNITATSVYVSWTTPADTPIHTFLIINKNVTMRKWNSQRLQFIVQPKRNKTFTMFFSNLEPNSLYEFAVRIGYHNHIELKKHWPHFNSSLLYSIRTLVEFPSPPSLPYVHKLNSGYEEVTWKHPDEKVPPNLFELQYKPVDSGNWTTIYNDSAPHWIIEEYLQDGENYIFRVRARNSRGWSNFSKSSRPFLHQIDRATSSNMYQYALIPITLFIIIIIVILICILFKKKQTEKKRITHVNDGHNPDVELATLQDLPHIAVQQNNTLYSVGMVPTDADLIALPHFRHDQLIRKKFLGSGAFGEVFEGVCKSCVANGETRVAVKTLRKCASEHEKEEFLKEALLMSNFKHEHILRLLGVCFDGNPQFIVLELMEGGDLLLYLRNYRPTSTSQVSLTLLDLMKICVHVSRGCKYLEEMHFVHRDLAARNCLVSSKNPRDMVVKIGDFGLARDIYKNDYYRKEGEGLLPVRWMSPESLVDGVFTTQSDIWSFGVLMWEVITYGQQPYPARTNLEVLQYVRSGGRLDRPDNCPEYLYQLKLNCWSYAPEDRPTSSFILEQLELFYQRLFEESMLNKNTTNSTAGTENDEKLGIPPNAESYIMTDTDMGHSQNRIPKSSIGSEFNAEDDPTPLLEDDNTSTNTSDYLEPSKLETPKYLELISDKPNATAGKQVVRGARPKTNSTSSFCNSPPQLPDKCHQNGTKTNNNNNNENLTSNGSTKSKGSTGARRNFQGLHYAQLATCSTDSSVDESDDESCTEMNYITPQVSMSCTLLNQVQNEPGHQRHLSKQTSAPAPLHNNSLSNEGIWVNSGSMDNQNSNNYLFHNSCASPTKLQVWADKNRNLVSKNNAVLAISDCPEYINTPQPNSLNYPSGQQNATGTPIFSSQPTLV